MNTNNKDILIIINYDNDEVIVTVIYNIKLF